MATKESPEAKTDGKSEQPSKSHPAIQFRQIPAVSGPLSGLNRRRKKIIEDVVKRSTLELDRRGLELCLGEASYQEHQRMRKIRKINPSYYFNFIRHHRDRQLWRKVRSGLVRPPTEVGRAEMASEVLDHYAREVCGKFSSPVYLLATRVAPWSFNWLLNAASVNRFLPWGMTESLESRLHIVGEVPHLQKIAKKGTVLLVPTHQSNIDSILVGYVIYLMSLPPFSYGAGMNLFTNPVLSFFMSNLGAYTVDRQKRNEIYKTILKNYSARILEEGVHSVFYPGGGRSRSGAIETHLKLGLLGTGISAQIAQLQNGLPNSKVFIVPMVTSYEFVFEASSLVEDYLAGLGKHRFLGSETDEAPPIVNTIRWFWKFFSSESTITVRIGRPLDVFGNFVDEEGRSVGPNGTTIDPRHWLTTRGELREEPQRDQEYTRELGRRLVERYYAENTVLSAHLVAFTLFISLRKRYPDLDLFRFLRLSSAQRSVPFSEFLRDAQALHQKLCYSADRGELYVSDELRTNETKKWVRAGMKNLGLFHDHAVVRERDGVIWTEDMNLLYYYRNRLAGYGFSLLGDHGRAKTLRGEVDEKGFLA